MASVDILPGPRLRPFVQLIWSLELDQSGGAGGAERIAPDGVVEVVFHYRTPMAMAFAGGDSDPQPRSGAVTLTRRFVEIAPRGPVGFLAVRFRPWGASRFLSLPVAELADRTVGAADLWGGTEVAALEQALAEASGLGERVALVEAFLEARLSPGGDPRAEAAVRAIWQAGGSLRPRELGARLGLGERSLERLLLRHVGMTPRSFIRLQRFLATCARLRSGRPASLAALAQDCGYYDQSHCIADVRAFSGMTPGELLAASGFSFLEFG